MTTLYFDLETLSPVPLKFGTHRYAEQAEVLLFPHAVDDSPVRVWDVASGEPMPGELRAALDDSAVEVVAHNGAMFDLVVLRAALGINIPTERLFDTMVCALAHGLPGSLGALGEIYRLPEDKQKDSDGRRLVRLFCIPDKSGRPKATRLSHPKEWKSFVDYARRDVEAMRVLHKKLPRWNFNERERRLWALDQLINTRGFRVDTELAMAARTAIESAQQYLAGHASEISDGSVKNIRSRDDLMASVSASYGIELENAQASYLEKLIGNDELPEGLRELLAVRVATSQTSTVKYETLLNAVSADSRLRGTLQFDGASRTRRWSGRIFQPQNLARPKHKTREIDAFIRNLKAGQASDWHSAMGILDLCSSAVRGCIVSEPGKKLVISDLANIEGRVGAWLAKEEWKVRAFYAFDLGVGPDLYALAYARAFNVTPESVLENDAAGGTQRKIGKVKELALQYGGGVGAIVTFAMAYSLDLMKLAAEEAHTIPAWASDAAAGTWEWYASSRKKPPAPRNIFMFCDALKHMWRAQHPHIVSTWKEIEECAAEAIRYPGREYGTRGRLAFRRDGAWLRMLLPSGQCVCYASPSVEDGQLNFYGVNQKTRVWHKLQTFGGRMFENACQSLARDVMAENMQAAEDAGYNIVLSVHDELLTETPDTLAYSAARLSGILASPVAWAPGLPLAAKGFETYRYRKD